MSERALSFGAVAAAYEQHRPGYPDTVRDLVRAYAGTPILTALEIGAGTGKATRLFAAPPTVVTATDPDPAMLAELRRHVPAGVRTLRAAFEDLTAGDPHDLVYAAAALHWTSPDGRWPKIAAMLRPGGVFASFGGPIELADPAVAAAARAAKAPYVDRDDVAPPDGAPPGQAWQWPGTELRLSPLFTDVRQEVIARRLTVTPAGYLAHLSTVSAYLQLAPDDRRRVYDRLERVLPARVELTADVTVHLARTHP